MIYLRRLILFAVVAAVLMVPVLSFSDVKIMLKNGNEMTADNCREEASSYVCYIMGGTFEIEKRDVKTIKSVTSRTKYVQPDPAAAGDAEKNQAAPPKTGEDVKKESGEPAGRDAAVKGTGSEAEKRLKQIARRKQELSGEREQLIKDRRLLQDDLEKAPGLITPGKFEELKKRNAELDIRINMFNEEARRLNEEEKNILDVLKKQGRTE